MAADIGSKLKMLSLYAEEDDFANPFDQSITISSPTVSKQKKEKTKKTEKGDSLSSVLKEVDDFIGETEGNFDYDFESYISEALDTDEDLELKQSLISMGRKYTRKHEIDEDESEITKAFAPQEKELSSLYEELNKDKKNLQETITDIRSMRKNVPSKILSELVSAKAQYHNIALSVLKELSNIKKAKLDIQIKLNSKKDNNMTDTVSNGSLAVQQLLSMGHSALMESVGGREASSGAILDEDDGPALTDIQDSDDFIRQKYFSDREETDGDKFIKYENDNVKYVLLLDADTPSTIIAEDGDGNLIPDYPIPKDIEQLNFEIDKTSGTAIDQMNRVYTVRYTDDE